MSQETPGIGHNAPSEDYTPDQAEAARFVSRELNKCAAMRAQLRDAEQDCKSNLKSKGVTSRALAIGQRARKSTTEDPIGLLDTAMRFVDSSDFEEEREELDRIAEERRDISIRERALRKEAEAAGVNTRALSVVRSMERMDAIERAEFFDSVVALSKAMRFW